MRIKSLVDRPQIKTTMDKALLLKSRFPLRSGSCRHITSRPPKVNTCPVNRRTNIGIVVVIAVALLLLFGYPVPLYCAFVHGK